MKRKRALFLVAHARVSACTLHLTFSGRCATRVHARARTSLPYIRPRTYIYIYIDILYAAVRLAPRCTAPGLSDCQLAILCARMHLHTVISPPLVSEKLARPKIRPENSLSSYFRPRPFTEVRSPSGETRNGWFSLRFA